VARLAAQRRADAEAVRWYRKAAEQGNAAGQTNLGWMYAEGRGGLAKDDGEAVRWYRKAAEQGDPEARSKLRASAGG
jgi:TPR repeat protein